MMHGNANVKFQLCNYSQAKKIFIKTDVLLHVAFQRNVLCPPQTFCPAARRRFLQNVVTFLA